MNGPICPFCGCDPFHYVDTGVGMQAVAVTCCELGDQLYRGARPTPAEVTLSWDEFVEIAGMLSEYRARAARADDLENLVELASEALCMTADGTWQSKPRADAISILDEFAMVGADIAARNAPSEARS